MPQGATVSGERRDIVAPTHVWLLAKGMTATAAARVTGYSAYWIGQIARRYSRD